MTTPGKRAVALYLIFLLCGGCQDVQPGSTPEAPIEQTGMRSVAATDAKWGTELEVRLEAIDRSRPQVSLKPRNPFRFGGSTAIVPSGRDLALSPLADEPPPLFPAVNDVVSRVPLRVIGFVDASETAGRIAVLTDGDVVFHGREGEIVEGQYRILSIGPMSVEIESVHDGRRQTLRLAGS